MRVFLICLIIAAWLMMAASLLLCSASVTMRARTDMRGGSGRLILRWLCFRYTLRLRWNLLREPKKTLVRVKHDGSVAHFAGKDGKNKFELDMLPTPQMLSVHITCGMRDEAARTALACGWLQIAAETAARGYLPSGWLARLRISCETVVQADALFIGLEGMILLTPVQIIAIVIQMKKRGE